MTSDKGNGKYTFTMSDSKVTASAKFVEAQVESALADVPTNAYYADVAAWAAESGVTNGASATTCSPNNGYTRAQIVTFLYRAYQGK